MSAAGPIGTGPDAPSADAAPSAAFDPRAGRIVLVVTILASAMAFIDGTVVTIALPAIQDGLGASFAEVQWIVNGYVLMLGALILVAGSLGDRFGRRRVFAIGVALFAVASLACAVAPGPVTLIAARTAQGIGGALLVPQSLAIITAVFPRATRGRAIGTWAAASSVTTALGPPLGGFLVDGLGWRAAFWINLPLAIVVLVLLRRVPESRDPAASGRVDWLGAAVAVAAFAALAYGLTTLGAGLPAPTEGYLALGLGVIGLVAFVAIEARVAAPVMPLALFRSRVFTGTNLLTVFLYGALAGVSFLLPFDLIERRGLSAAASGATMVPIAIVIAVLSRLTGGIADRIGPRPFLVGGSAVFALGAAGLALGLENYVIGVLLPIVVLAIGMGLVVAPLTTAVMNAAPEGKAGAASGINNAASRLAGLIAVALLGALASIVFLAAPEAAGLRFGVLPEPGDPARAGAELAFGVAYSAAMWAAVGLAVLAALAAWLTLRPGPDRAAPA